MEKFKIIYLTLVILLIGCSHAQKVNSDDFYDIVNIILNEAKEKRDSIHIIDWKSDKFYKNSKEKYNNDDFSILNFKRTRGEKVFSVLRKFLAKHNINVDEEIPFFKEQLKYPMNLDRKRIILKELRIFPSESDWYSIKYNYSFTNYYYVLSKPLITRNGLQAIYYQGGSDYANFFIVLAKEDNKWKEIDRFNANRIIMD